MSQATEALARQHSITKNDHSDLYGGLSMFNFFPAVSQSMTPGLPEYWSPMRDAVLKRSLFLEAMWSAAIYKVVSKQVALGFTIDDTQDRQMKARRAQEIFLHADYVRGRAVGGWVPFLTRHLLDVELADNGTFVGVIRATPAVGSKFLGLEYLDTHRCERTGNARFPVIFTELDGTRHKLAEHQVICYADMAGTMPGPAGQIGIGISAASRAYRAIARLAAIEQYLYEKITGSKATSVFFVGPMSPNTLQSGFATAEAENARKGMQLFKGANIIPVIADVPPGVAEIKLSELPDGFDPEQERQNAYAIYATAIGMPSHEIISPTGSRFGTGTETKEQADAAELQGLAGWRKWFEQTVNSQLLAESTTFTFATNNLRKQKAEAEIAKLREETRASMIGSGEITTEEARQIAADDGDLPKEFLKSDQTPGGTLDDTDKPVSESETPEAEEVETDKPEEDKE